MRGEHLKSISEFILGFCDEEPVDWLTGDWLVTRNFTGLFQISYSMFLHQGSGQSTINFVDFVNELHINFHNCEKKKQEIPKIGDDSIIENSKWKIFLPPPKEEKPPTT
jgi:hypothetical protein